MLNFGGVGNFLAGYYRDLYIIYGTGTFLFT